MVLCRTPVSIICTNTHFILFEWNVLDFREYRIPKGTILFANLYQVHHSPEYWQKPDEFYPEHFLDSEGQLKTPETFLPFSIGTKLRIIFEQFCEIITLILGKRSCIGESLARMELFLFTSALLQKFTFTLPTDEPTPSLEPDGFIVMTPKPFKIILQLRQ